MLEEGADRTALVLRLACSDLNPACPTELTGRTTEDLMLQYAQHSFSCMYRTAPVELERVQSTITTA